MSIPTTSQQSQSQPYASAFDEFTDTAMTDAVFRILEALRNPAFNNFDKVQAGLMCKACEVVLRSEEQRSGANFEAPYQMAKVAI
ncbi:hypothetical protein E4U30_003112 [Claviceps sp. LM220 group G6]|nr:hypothetical protein E4U15_002360 [Claviceps sp. LM218 group G6]KAG6094700.1 hypothetical protein E4U30_003112 [Claviceps sp. LM220 group G6]